MFKILVIDDDKNIRFFLKEVLSMQKFEVFTASDGNIGFDILQNNHPEKSRCLSSYYFHR